MHCRAVVLSLVLLGVGLSGAADFGPSCGNRIVEEGEECEVGFGCKDCRCVNSTTPTIPRSVNCLPPDRATLSNLLACPRDQVDPTFVCIEGVNQMYLSCIGGVLSFSLCPAGLVCPATSSPQDISPCSVPTEPGFHLCGNELVEPSEQCDGGQNCGQDCRCGSGGFMPSVPFSRDCVSRSIASSPGRCGNGVLEGGEDCEAQGATCDSSCHCSGGTEKTNPPSVYCLNSFTADLNSVCSRFSGFVCIENVTLDYLECRDGTANFFACPVGSLCLNTTSVTQSNPCLALNSTSPACGNTVLEKGEACEIQGANCGNCTCLDGFVETIPRSINCVRTGSNASNLTALCAMNLTSDQQGPLFVCVPDVESQFVSCVNGSGTFGQCPPDNSTGCSSTNFTTFNPCIVVPLRSCGNGVLDELESCDGGTGCLGNCTCAGSFLPTDPLSVNCTACGNGALDSGEQCDSGDGCLANCSCSAGFSTTSPPSANCTRCGNGILDPGEFCDSGEGCQPNCTCGTNFSATLPPSANCTRCGNGFLDPGEQCEIGGANCTDNCTCGNGTSASSPPSFNCTASAPSPAPSSLPQMATRSPTPPVSPLCGQVPDPQCEPGGVGCNPDCRCYPGFAPRSPPSRDCIIPP